MSGIGPIRDSGLSYLKVAENPVTFKVDKPGIQADRLLCLVKLLAHRQFWESSLSVKFSPFPVGIGIQ